MNVRLARPEANVEHSSPAPSSPMTLIEKRQIFREMVHLQRRNGPLSVWRRRQLVQYAASLGLNPVQAGKIVDEARGAAAAQYITTMPQLGCVTAAPAADESRYGIATFILLATAALNLWVMLSIVY